MACIALGLLLAGAPSRVRAQTVAQDAAVLTLAPGDQVRIAVWGHPEFSGDFVISQDGMITHPLLREVRAVGIPMSQLEARIKTFLSRYVAEPAFVLTPLMHVFVGGEVRVPSGYTAPPGTTVDQALFLAGGPNPLARLDSVVLVRDHRRSVIDLTVEGGTAGLTAVHSGDQILVPRAAEPKSFVRDVLVPTVGVVAVLTGIANLVVTLTRHP
jgi:polysaccharide export outer membrane protein